MDKQLLEFFNNKKNGFFCEVGAADGVDQSNTFLLEKKYGWKGLLVEPIFDQYIECCKYRKNSIVESRILVSEKMFHRSNKKLINNNSLQSQIIDTEGSSENNNVEIVDTSTLNRIFKKNNISHIDIFSLDVEGYEIEVLEGYDHLSGIIEYLLVETWDIENFKEYANAKDWKLLSHFGNNDYLFKLK